MNNTTVQKLMDFFSAYTLQNYQKGEIIHRPGDTITQVSFIKSGYVRMYALNPDGKETTINFFKPVFYMTLMLAVRGEENEYYFEAITPVELWKAPVEEVKNLLANNSDLVFEIAQLFAGALDDAVRNTVDTSGKNSYIKLAKTIQSLAKNYGVTENGRIHIDFETSHRILASITGLTRETTSIQIKKLENEGYISQEKSKIIILKPEELELMVQK